MASLKPRDSRGIVELKKLTKEIFLYNIIESRKCQAESVINFPFNKSRCEIISKQDEIPENCKNIVYWMSRDCRVQDNWAFLFAQRLAIKYNVPLHICFFCKDSENLYPTKRQVCFLLTGLKKVKQECESLNINFYLVNDSPEYLPKLVLNNDVGGVVCDFSPLKQHKKWIENILKHLPDTVAFIRWVNDFPSYLCDTCNENLQLCYNFQMQFKESLRLIEDYLERAKLKECIIIKQDDGEELMGLKNEQCELDISEKDSASDLMGQEHYRRKSILEVFDIKDVNRAIEDFKCVLNRHTNCVVCSFETTTSRILSVHMSNIHKDLKEKWCPFCNILVEELANHMKTHPDKYECEFCQKSLKRRYFIAHLKGHSGVRSFECDICHKLFLSQSSLKWHYKHHNDNEKPFKCTKCEKRFVKSISLQTHLKTHEIYDCHNCKSNFTTRKLLECHDCCYKEKYEGLDDGDKEKNANFYNEYGIVGEQELHMKSRDNKVEGPQLINIAAIDHSFCNQCNIKVTSLTEHLKQFHPQLVDSTEEKNKEHISCPVCGQKFKSTYKYKLKAHLRLHYGESAYKCSHCNKKLQNRSVLIEHERTHTGERPYMCNVCGKGFSQSSGLRTHMRLHTGRPEVCKLCDKRFCRPAELKLHIRKHTGEKPFLCTECGKAFIQRSHLTEHIKSHSEERPYACQFCEKTFKKKTLLKCHVQIHIGNKPFKCEKCSYACFKRFRLGQHMKQHDDTKPLEKSIVCQICNKGFSSVALLNSHMSYVHNAVL